MTVTLHSAEVKPGDLGSRGVTYLEFIHTISPHIQTDQNLQMPRRYDTDIESSIKVLQTLVQDVAAY